jgi:hypothetical protein
MGVGTMMMTWGLKIAERMSLPVFVESTTDAQNFYEKNDFKVIEAAELDAPISNQGSEYEQVRAQLMPVPYLVMARRLGGKGVITDEIKPVIWGNATNDARETTCLHATTSASFLNSQFLGCSFVNCRFENCSIENGRIFTQQPNL